MNFLSYSRAYIREYMQFDKITRWIWHTCFTLTSSNMWCTCFQQLECVWSTSKYQSSVLILKNHNPGTDQCYLTGQKYALALLPLKISPNAIWPWSDDMYLNNVSSHLYLVKSLVIYQKKIRKSFYFLSITCPICYLSPLRQ